MTMPINTPTRRLNLSRLMYSGYQGGSVLVGVTPTHVIQALQRRFDVVSCFSPGVYDHELRCYDESTGLRLRVQYRQDRVFRWQYNPVAVRRRDRH